MRIPRIYHPTPLQPSSIIALNDDAAAKFGTKVEIFSMDQDEEESEQRRNSTQVNSGPLKDSTLIEEENKKMYTALLQN